MIQGAPTETGFLPPIEIAVILDKQHTEGALHMTFSDTQVIVSTADEKGEKIELGSITGVVGGGIEINDKRTGKLWYFSAKAIWEAYQAMIAEQVPQENQK